MPIDWLNDKVTQTKTMWNHSLKLTGVSSDLSKTLLTPLCHYNASLSYHKWHSQYKFLYFMTQIPTCWITADLIRSLPLRVLLSTRWSAMMRCLREHLTMRAKCDSKADVPNKTSHETEPEHELQGLGFRKKRLKTWQHSAQDHHMKCSSKTSPTNKELSVATSTALFNQLLTSHTD